MNSEQLAKEVLDAVLAVQGRILSVGAQQYEEEHGQKFELMSLQEIIQYAMEEVEDGIAYNVMLRYKLRLLKDAIESAFAGYATNKARHARPAQVVPDPTVTPAPAQMQAPMQSSAPQQPQTLYQQYGSVPVGGYNVADLINGRSY
ncbi:hypothetical protein [Nonomuraea candida]|uniref:hypothetical protein n=1 Tax=Nonomuraea candida TaxID=359159 RepID=UPI0005BD8856|nr:hypothetical protein [Nonomuraea candida]